MFTILGGDGKEYGPVSADQIRVWLSQNRANLDTRLKAAGSEEWRRLGDIPEFAAGPGASGGAGLLPTTTADGSPSAPVTASEVVPPSKLEFTGDWTEYFKIWIVNVLLTVVTLGIYAAWAKVRKRRYFYANTKVFGHTFEYLANPVKIFYGNMIVVGVFAIYALVGAISPLFQVPIMLLFAIAAPWFIVRAFAFNARNTAWRGLRFNFTGTYGESAQVFLLWPLLVVFTFGLIIPFIAKKQKAFTIDRHAFGTTAFSFTGKTAGFYRIYGISLLFFIPVLIAYIGIIANAIVSARNGAPAPGSNVAAMGMLGLLLVFGLPLAIAGSFYFRSRMFNYLWSNTSLAGNTFAASMRARDLFGIHFVNSIVTFFTLGLLHPWAAVRIVKYQLDSLEIVPGGNVDTFVAAAQPPVTALGEAASDFFDFDLGFGL
jgi:uncharacterized membrane protein YjgN (DUF898 family)